MGRGLATLLLGVVGAGAFLSGLELMITAVALPAIVVDLADWTELRAASWIINGYLLVSIVVMPLAGQLADRHGVRRVFLVALVVFVAGSILAGRATGLADLITSRLVQAIGGGSLVPVATAAASHLFAGTARPRALGAVGALTFLGMAAGPFAGAWIMQSIHPAAALEAAGIHGPLFDALAASWRYVFYLNVPIGIALLAVGWAATSAWSPPQQARRLDLPGALFASIGLAALLLGVTLAGSEPIEGVPVEPAVLTAGLLLVALAAFVITISVARRRSDPFIDPAWFRSPAFASATLISLLTGYGFATAIIGGAVFVDRVLYGGPDQQRLALGALAGATALGALVSGFAVRVLSLRLVTLAGLLLCAATLWLMSGWTPAVTIGTVALVLGAFGLGFGLTVTPRSTAAIESAGRASFGMASAIVTVARMIGMAIGVAILTAYGSTTIDRLYDRLFSAANP
jgi:MFS family permease